MSHEPTDGQSVGLYCCGYVLHLHELVADEGAGRQVVWVELERALEVQHGLLVLRPQRVVVTCNQRRKEGNVLFNDALNTFYLRLYGIGHMVKDHTDSERGNTLPPHGYSFRLTARVLLYAPSHRQGSTYHSLYYTSCGALAGRRNRI